MKKINVSDCFQSESNVVHYLHDCANWDPIMLGLCDDHMITTHSWFDSMIKLWLGPISAKKRDA